MRKITLSKAKQRAWNAFSKYIRLRDCFKTTRRRDLGLCVTCSRAKEFKLLHAGHFLPGRHSSILFDEVGCHAQCYVCNVVLGGNGARYYEFMLKEYGLETINRLLE